LVSVVNPDCRPGESAERGVPGDQHRDLRIPIGVSHADRRGDAAPEADRDRSIEQVIFACFSPDVLDAYAAEGVDVADAAADPET
jgi:hypothetical protein